MAVLCLLLGDQLNLSMSSLQKIDKKNDYVLMAEVNSEATYVKHHKQKIAFLFSAMRHFCQRLKDEQYKVTYIDYLNGNNKGCLFKQVQDFINNNTSIDKLVVAKPGEYRLFEDIRNWSDKLNVYVEIAEDNRFMATEEDFANWAKGKKQLRMEFFYREMRKTFGYLIEDKSPVGGKWNFDSDNRKKLPKDKTPPPPTKFEQDDITQIVIELVKNEFDDHFGDLDEFHYAVTREQALTVLDEFIVNRLENFGDYQDAMAQDEPWMYHSHISFYLNAGLLSAKEVLDAAQNAYDNELAPLNAIEGFIRQILGWREYVRGFYWYFMPKLKSDNYLNANRTLPSFYWTGDTDMNCLSQSISQTKKYSYAHHIQRLMVLGNFALLAGLDPNEVNEWYLIVYSDAYEWVELPNVSGMILFSDGGNLASKPYAASGSYINKMSNYCAHCRYSVKEKTGKQACPFNYLYWDFIQRHKSRFVNNPRMAMIYKTMERMDSQQLMHMQEDANTFFEKLANNEKV